MTPFELILQQELERSRRDPLGDYGRALVTLEQTKRSEQQRAAELANAANLHRELTAAEIKANAELEKQREAAALERVKVGGQLDIERAQAIATAQVKLLSEKEKEEQKNQFRRLNIQQKPGESDDDYIIRASGERDKLIAGQIDQSYSLAQGFRDRAQKILSDVNQKRSDAVFDRIFESAKALIPPNLVAKAKTREEKMALLNDAATKDHVLSAQLGTFRDKAEAETPQIDPANLLEFRSLSGQADVIEKHAAGLLSNPLYAGAIPHYTQLIADRAQAQQKERLGPPLPPGGTDASVLKSAATAPQSPAELSPWGFQRFPGTRPFFNVGSALGSAGEAAAGLEEAGVRRGAQALGLVGQDEIVNPGGRDVYLNSLGVPAGFNLSAARRPPTADEVAAYAAARRGAAPVGVPPELLPATAVVPTSSVPVIGGPQRMIGLPPAGFVLPPPAIPGTGTAPMGAVPFDVTRANRIRRSLALEFPAAVDALRTQGITDPFTMPASQDDYLRGLQLPELEALYDQLSRRRAASSGGGSVLGLPASFTPRSVPAELLSQ